MKEKQKIIYVFFLILFLTLAECARPSSRQNKKDSRSKVVKTRVMARNPGEVFENLFNIYDPTFLAIVWPKITNGVHLFVDGACWDDLSVFFNDLAEGRAWAYTAVDASGRYQSGLLQGNTFWLGSKRQCLQLDDEYAAREDNGTFDEFHNDVYLNGILRREKYFDGGAKEWRSLVQSDELVRQLVAADNTPPYSLSYTVLQLTLNLTKVTLTKSYELTLGVCLPRSCNLKDIASVVKFSIMLNDNFKSNKTIPRTIDITALRQIDKYYDIKRDTGLILLISITLLLFIIAVIATMVDLKLVKCRPHNSKSMSFDLQKFNNNTDENRALDEENRNHNCDVLSRKEANVVDMETLTINNINNANNINLVTVKKVTKPLAMPPSITLDVVSMEKMTGSCQRCGKYKKQCNTNPRHIDNLDKLPACPRVKSFASLTETKQESKFFRSLLLCFSLNYSWKRIFNTNMANKDLAVVHGLKIIATFWIIFVHVATIVSYVSESGEDINEYNNAYYTLLTGTLAFDTFFFVSGLFSAHHFFYLKSQYTVEELVSFGGTCGQILQFVCFVTNRAIRLLPSYAYAIFLTAVLSRITHHTSPLSLPERDDRNCDEYWWRNLLYLTTFFPRDQQCMQISWYMSTETQLHIAGAFTCAVLASYRIAACLAVAALLVASAADVSDAYAHSGDYLSSVFAAYSIYIERPVARVAPYFIGIFSGWLLHSLNGRLKLSKMKASILWVTSFGTVLMSLSLPWVTRAWVTSWLHLIWPIALLWPALVFATNFAALARCIIDNSTMAALSRLSYSMLLLHGPVARSLLLSAHTALCSHTVCIWSYFAVTTAVTLLGALVLSLLVETPCCSLLRRLSDYAS